MQQSISQKGQRFHYDVIVIGGGIAGLCYISELLTLRPHVRIALVTKNALTESNSYYAQGGIAAAISKEDIQSHRTDTLMAGDELCNEAAVTAILAEGPASIQFLLEQGVQFDGQAPHFARGMEAGHSERRIYHVGDRTGQALIQALTDKIKNHQQVDVLEFHTAVNLITHLEPHEPGCLPEVLGVYVLEEKKAEIHTLLAKVVVLATGGAGKVYRYTSNPHTATGDGVAMAYRAGARVGGLEFYQFHPTLLYHPRLTHFLVSEALRGEGAYLRHPETDERFMQRYAPKEMELATRDHVARAIFYEIEQSNHDYVYLDIRHKDKTFLQNRFPVIYHTLLNEGIDLAKDYIPVVPAAHYMGGGILSDVQGRTDLRRLFAIGETAFTGLHGANRLASNSLLEGVVMGRHAAQASIAELDQPFPLRIIQDWNSTSITDLRRASQMNVHWRGLRGEMSSYAGIVRTEAGLRDQLQLVLARKKMIEEFYWKYTITRDLIELRNIVLVAELIVRAALKRCESRGGHYREDYPNKQEKQDLFIDTFFKFNEYNH